MVKVLIQVVGTADCADIQCEIFLDNQRLTTYLCSLEPHTVEIKLPDQAGSHDLQIQMHGKTQQHTVVNDAGEIESDASILIQRLEFEEIDMMPIFCQGQRCYFHSNNNALLSAEQDEFYGYIGCNGDVHIRFETPIYLWFNQHFAD